MTIRMRMSLTVMMTTMMCSGCQDVGPGEAAPDAATVVDARCVEPIDTGWIHDDDPAVPQVDIVVVTTEYFRPDAERLPNPWLGMANVSQNWYQRDGWSARVAIVGSGDTCPPVWHWTGESTEYNYQQIENQAEVLEGTIANLGLDTLAAMYEHTRPRARKVFVLASPRPDCSTADTGIQPCEHVGHTALDSWDSGVVAGDGMRVEIMHLDGTTEVLYIPDERDQAIAAGLDMGARVLPYIAPYQTIWYSALGALHY